MRKAAGKKIIELYKSSPLFQDLLETALGTTIAAGGQAIFTDMTPEEIALTSGATFGAGMIGRPLIGTAGQYLGKVVDSKYPVVGEALMEGIDDFVQMSGPLRPAIEAKLAPYSHLGGSSQYFNLLGRGYGDNLAQAAVALAAPSIFADDEKE